MADPVPWTWLLGGEPSEEREALTDILSAVHGAEQRRGLRMTPRLYLRFDGLSEGADMRALEQRVATHGADEWLVPFKFDGAPLHVSAPAGTSELSIDTRWRHFAAGGQALIIGANSRQFEVVNVEDLDDETLTLAEATVQAWPAGVLVYPAIRCHLAEQPAFARFTADSIAYSLRFRAAAPVPEPTGHGLPLYRGLPVFEVDIDWSAGDPSTQPERLLAGTDDGVAIPNVFDMAGVPLPRQVRNVCARTHEQVAQLRALLAALDGRRCPLWIPTLAADLVVTAAVANGAVQMFVAWTGISQTAPMEGRRDLRIELHNGTVLYRRVTAATLISDTTERLTLDTAIATGFSAADVALVCWMVPSRQDSDIAVLGWWGHGIATSSLVFRGLRDGL